MARHFDFGRNCAVSPRAAIKVTGSCAPCDRLLLPTYFYLHTGVTADMTASEKPLDIVVFGASGYTGRLVAEYLAAGIW